MALAASHEHLGASLGTSVASQVLPTGPGGGARSWVFTPSPGAAGKEMGSASLLWRLSAWLLVLGLQSVSGGGRIKKRTCISYGSHNVAEGVEHLVLPGFILEDGRNNTIRCPHNQCCFGVWNLTRGQLQAKVQGCWIKEKKRCDSLACESRPLEDTEAATIVSCRCRSDLCNANIKLQALTTSSGAITAATEGTAPATPRPTSPGTTLSSTLGPTTEPLVVTGVNPTNGALITGNNVSVFPSSPSHSNTANVSSVPGQTTPGSTDQAPPAEPQALESQSMLPPSRTKWNRFRASSRILTLKSNRTLGRGEGKETIFWGASWISSLSCHSST